MQEHNWNASGMVDYGFALVVGYVQGFLRQNIIFPSHGWKKLLITIFSLFLSEYLEKQIMPN
jgi:hypothetical protein